MNKFDECNCECHHNRSMMHCVPCCYECQYCGKNIVRLNFDEHVELCKKEVDKLNSEDNLKPSNLLPIPISLDDFNVYGKIFNQSSPDIDLTEILNQKKVLTINLPAINRNARPKKIKNLPKVKIQSTEELIKFFLENANRTPSIRFIRGFDLAKIRKKRRYKK